MRENMMNHKDYQKMVAELKYERALTQKNQVAKIAQIDNAIAALEHLVRMH